MNEATPVLPQLSKCPTGIRGLEITAVKDYGMAIGAVTLAFLARWILWPILGSELQFVLHWPAIFVAAWCGGFRAGLLATLLSAVGTAFFLMEPRWSLMVANTEEKVGLGLFLIMGAGLSLFVDWARQSERARLSAECETQASHATSAYYRSLIETILDPMVVKGPDGKITDVNHAAETATGRNRAELIGTEFSGYFTEPDKARRLYQQVYHEGGVRNFYLEIRHHDGYAIPVLYSASVYRDQAGNVAGVVATVRDISERQQAEEQLRTSHERLALALEAAHAGTFDWDIRANVIFWSAEAEAMHGIARGQFGGTYADWEVLVVPDDLNAARAAVETALKTGEFVSEWRIRRRDDGQIRWIDARGKVVFDKAGKPLKMIGVNSDITERKTKEADLKKMEWLLSGVSDSSENREAYEQPYGDLVQLNTNRLLADEVGAGALGSLTRNTMDVLETSAAIYEKNGDYALGIFSSGWCRFMDHASRKLCGTSDNREALASGKWICHESCWETSKASIESGQPVDVACKGGIRLFAVPVRRGDEIVGSLNFGYGDPPRDPQKLAELAELYQVSVEELRQAASEYESRPTYLVNLAKERLKTSAAMVGAILEAKHAKAEIEELNRGLEARILERTAQVEAANKELEAFAYSVSHDLRSPLRAIDGFSQILLKEYLNDLPDKPRHYLQVVCDNARQMGRLIDDLLRFSRSNRQSVQPQTVHPREIVDHCLEEMKPELEGRRVDIAIGDLPECWGDGGLLKQVWFNLLANALKYSRKSNPARIEIGSEIKDGETVYFVRDNGVGFDMQYAHKLFGVFQRLHAAEDYEGTGIGLALVQRILHRHGGRIWADAKVGQGATFFFTLGRRTGHA